MSFSKLEGLKLLSKNEKLQALSLSFDLNLTTLDGIGQLKQLTTLRLVGLPINDLSELEKLTSLTLLNISDIPMENTDFLEN